MTKTIRLTAKEQNDLENLVFELNKSLVKNNLRNVGFYKEADVVHFLLKSNLDKIGINENGEICLLWSLKY